MERMNRKKCHEEKEHKILEKNLENFEEIALGEVD